MVTTFFWGLIYYWYGTKVGSTLVQADFVAICVETVCILLGIYASYSTLGISIADLEHSKLQRRLQVGLVVGYFFVQITNAITDVETTSSLYDLAGSLHAVAFSALLLPVIA